MKGRIRGAVIKEMRMNRDCWLAEEIAQMQIANGLTYSYTYTLSCTHNQSPAGEPSVGWRKRQDSGTCPRQLHHSDQLSYHPLAVS